MSIIFSTDKPTLVNNLTIVDGLTRTGKFFLAKLISGMKNVEYFQYSFTLDILPYIAKLGELREDVAISTLRAVLDQKCYDLSIGRNLNTRFDDRSPIYNSPEADKYILRTKSTIDRDKIVNTLSNKNTTKFLFVQHNNLANVEIMIKAFPELKIIHLIRNPIDLVYSWMMKDYGKTILNSKVDLFKISIAPSICGEKGPLPWYTHNIINEYENLNQIDRIIISIHTLTKMCKKSYVNLSKDKQDRIMFARYESVVEDTHNIIDDISNFIGINKSKYMDAIIKKENCPNFIGVKNRAEKKRLLKDKATKNYFKLLETMENDYLLND